MITENLSTLKIHKLTQAQYDREVQNGTIDENALYLTPDEEIDLTPYALKADVASTYETKSDAASKLNDAKAYADSAANEVKNDLLNGAGTAYDTLKELGDLINENTDAIDALETVATSKADKDHTHDDRYYTEAEIDAMVFITVDDIDTICGTTIELASDSGVVF